MRSGVLAAGSGLLLLLPACTGSTGQACTAIGPPFGLTFDMSATPTAHVRLHDEGGPITREVSTPVAARAVTSDVNGPGCLSDGYWGAVQVEPDGRLTDVTATTPMPDSLQPR